MKNLSKIVLTVILSLIMVKSTFSQQNDEALFNKYIALSAWHGVFYGIAADIVFEIENDKALVALPIITSGTCALIPLLTNESRTMTSNQLLLTGHGQLIGWAHGSALGLLINGAKDQSSEKLIVGLGAATSIGLGLLGKSLAKTQPWSEGQVAVYRHYGLMMPGVGTLIAASFSENARLYGAAILVSGASGYAIAHLINKKDQFTRGEIRATQALTTLNGFLGAGIYIDILGNNEINDEFRPGFLLPAAGIIAGSTVGQHLMKNTELTARQGMTTIYAAGLGALIGSGIAILVGVEDEYDVADYLIPYTTGTLTFAYALHKIKSKNTLLQPESTSQTGNWNFSLMPQNIFLNNKISEKGYVINGKMTGMQPLFSASLSF
jgi:hypothetical protein